MRSQRGGERNYPSVYTRSLVAAEEARPRAEQAVETRARRSLVAASRLVDEGDGDPGSGYQQNGERDKALCWQQGVNTGNALILRL